jgi:7-cyano-7-deazaguanine reductase
MAKTAAAKSAPKQRPMPPNPPTAPSKELHVFDNPAPERDYVIQFEVPEFTCNCPLTGQPDFAQFKIEMVADKLCVELKSLKMYFWSYRNEGAFHEKVTNTILDDIVQATDPRFIRITAKWNVRGGIYTSVVAEHRKKGWKPAAVVTVPTLD